MYSLARRRHGTYSVLYRWDDSRDGVGLLLIPSALIRVGLVQILYSHFSALFDILRNFKYRLYLKCILWRFTSINIFTTTHLKFVNIHKVISKSKFIIVITKYIRWAKILKLCPILSSIILNVKLNDDGIRYLTYGTLYILRILETRSPSHEDILYTHCYTYPILFKDVPF